MATEYTTLSVLLFTEGPDGWQSVTGLLNEDHAAPNAETAVTIIAMFDSWLAANAGADDAQFNWRLFEFCIIAGDKTRAATALETAVAKGKNLLAEVLAESQAKLA
jgi:hypothetical protein